VNIDADDTVFRGDSLLRGAAPQSTSTIVEPGEIDATRCGFRLKGEQAHPCRLLHLGGCSTVHPTDGATRNRRFPTSATLSIRGGAS